MVPHPAPSLAMPSDLREGIVPARTVIVTLQEATMTATIVIATENGRSNVRETATTRAEGTTDTTIAVVDEIVIRTTTLEGIEEMTSTGIGTEMKLTEVMIGPSRSEYEARHCVLSVLVAQQLVYLVSWPRPLLDSKLCSLAAVSICMI